MSPGCEHCYARTFAERWRNTPGHAYEHGFDLRLVPEKLIEPLRILKAKRVFVNSMSDLLHKEVPREFILDMVRVMEMARWHTFQVLTKRSSRMRNLLQRDENFAEAAGSPHIWWGVSVEDKKHGLKRLEHLQQITKAKVKWLSIEPLLEDLGKIDLTGINGVVVGGESGPGARPMEEAWVRSILEQCEEQKVPFFFKQWGGIQKEKTGRKLNGRYYNEQPKRVKYSVADKQERKAAVDYTKDRIQYWLGREDLGALIFRKKSEEPEMVTDPQRTSLPLIEGIDPYEG